MSVNPQQTQDAGVFSVWLEQTRLSMQTHAGSDVACGDCNACCSSAYFIHVRAHESASLKRIPKTVLVDAPGWPAGDKLMGYTQQGHCPMLQQGRCQMYAQRPQTCRDYDCRVFAATGLQAGAKDKQAINMQIRRWRFSYPTAQDELAQQAVRQAVDFIRQHAASFPGGRVPQDPTQLALLALKVYPVFMQHKPAQTYSPAEARDLASAIIASARAFDAQIQAVRRT